MRARSRGHGGLIQQQCWDAVGFKKYHGPINTVADAISAHRTITITCQRCSHYRIMWAYRLYERKKEAASLPLEKNGAWLLVQRLSAQRECFYESKWAARLAVRIEAQMDFTALERDVRCCALVGYFLQSWATMESSMNRAMGKALKLDGPQSAIVAKNVQFTAKMHVLQTALTLVMSNEEREKHKAMLGKISAATGIRNMMAHDCFFPSKKSDGVVFFTVKARGELDFPDIDWPISEFEKWSRQLFNWSVSIDRLGEKLKPTEPNALVEALLRYSVPVEKSWFEVQSPVSGSGLFGLLPRVEPSQEG